MKFFTATFLAAALSVLTLGLASASAVATPSKGNSKSLLASLSKNQKGLFDDSMALMDSLWNSTTQLVCVLLLAFVTEDVH